jgi:RNA polymerase sigma factor (sigma-70 family)
MTEGNTFAHTSAAYRENAPMDQPPPPDRLSQVSTSWTVLLQAHHDEAGAETARQARTRLLERYEPVVRLYLRGALRQWPNRDDAVEECFQDFALRFVSGAFRKATPDRGRFRDYLKTTLRNLVTDYQRKRRHQPAPLGAHEPAAEATAAEDDREFLSIWRDELLRRSLLALEQHDQAKGQYLYTVLRWRMDHPQMRSHVMAEQLGARLNRSLNAVWVRKRLALARTKLAEFLLAEVRQALNENSSADAVEQELIDLGLFEYCRSALDNDRAPE